MKRKLKLFPKKILTLTAIGSLAILNTIFNRIDPRFRSFATFTSGMLLAFLSIENSMLKYMGLGLMGASVLDSASTLSGGAINFNNYNGEVWVLRGDEKTLQKLKPYETTGIFKKIEGIATSFNKNHIYKVPNACLVQIKKNGDIGLTYVSKLINSRIKEKAGWYDASYVVTYPKWQGLLDKSNSF